MNRSHPDTPAFKVRYCCAVLLAIGCSSSLAAYSVIDDDLLPTVMAQARRTQVSQDHYLIPFIRDRSALTDADRAIMDMLLPRMNQASVRIVGRPDATIITPEKATLLARARANNMRDYLMRKGIPTANITVEVDSSPNPQSHGSTYPCDLFIGPPQYQQRRAYASANRLQTEEFLSGTPATQGPQLQPTETVNDQMMRFINQAVKSGQMETSVALKLLESMLPKPANGQAQQVQASLQPTQSVSPPQIGSSSATWHIRKSLSLRQNIEAWSKTEGYSVVWDLPAHLAPQLNTDGFFAAPSFAAAIEVLLKELHAKGYRFIAVNLYADRVVQFAEATSL